MRYIPQLKHLAILALVAQTARGAGLNVVPALPEPASSAPSTKESEEEAFWYTSWNTPPLHTWRGIDLRSTLDYKAFYTDNPLSSAGVHKEDFMHYVSPLLGFSRSFETEQRATLVSVAYQPTFVIGSLGNGGDRTYQLVRGNLSHLWNEKTVYLSHQFQDSSESSSQTAFLAPQQENKTTGGFRTPLTGKMSADFGFDQILIDSTNSKIGQARELRNWSAYSHFDYEVRPKLQTGVQLKVGYLEQLGTSFDSTFLSESLLSTWSYQVSGKLKANLDLGGQVVQSQTASVTDPSATPIAAGRLIYEPRYGTTVILGGGRSAGASQFFSGIFLTESTVDLSIRQRIYQDFLVSGRFGYSMGEYQQLILSSASVRRDYSSYTFSTDAQWRINARVTTGIFYQYLKRDSLLSAESFSANQVGLSLALSL